MAHTSMSLFEECKIVAANLQLEKVKFNKSLTELLATTYSVSLDEASKFGPREEVGNWKCEKAVVELRRVVSCGELLVSQWSHKQWTDKQWWKTVISSSDSASLQAKVVLHFKEFFVCVKVLRVIANGNQNLLFDHRNALLSEVRDLELSMSIVESDVEKACKKDLDSLKRWINKKYIRGWFVKPDDVKLANLVLEQLRPPGNSSLGHQPSSKLEYTDLIIDSRVLGEGGGGKVLACKVLGLEAAAKVFLVDSSNNANVVETEAKLFARLRHPNVVRFIAHVVHNDQHVIVSELMQMDLRKYLDEFNKRGDGSPRGLPLLEAVDIMLQIAQGMRYLHNGRMMHRDLKSKNVLVNVIRSPDSRVSSSVLQVKVTDFGLAKLTDNSRFTTRDVGTTRWRAPEVFEDDNNPGKYKKSADVYSFAMVFFEVLTGEIPFDGIPLGKLLQKLHSGLRPRLPRNECPKYLSALIKKCWSRNAARRPTFATICKTLVNCKVAILAAQSPSPRNILSYDSDDESRRSPSRLCSDCRFLL